MTLSYLNRATDRNYDALQASSEAVRLAPTSEEVLKNHLEILQRNRIVEPALRLAKENPNLVSAEHYRQQARCCCGTSSDGGVTNTQRNRAF